MHVHVHVAAFNVPAFWQTFPSHTATVVVVVVMVVVVVVTVVVVVVFVVVVGVVVVVVGAGVVVVGLDPHVLHFWMQKNLTSGSSAQSKN